MDQARVDVMDAPGPIHGCQLCLTGPPPWPGLEVSRVHPLPAELVSTWRAQASSCSLCLPALPRSSTEAYPPTPHREFSQTSVSWKVPEPNFRDDHLRESMADGKEGSALGRYIAFVFKASCSLLFVCVWRQGLSV